MSWLPPLLLAVIAACAAWVAAQQMMIARQKLNHDLFDRRYAIFEATQNYLVVCINNNGGTQQDTGVFYQAIRSAPFLFGKEINEYLTLVMKHSINIQVFGDHVCNSSLPDWQKFMEIYHASEQWVTEEHPKLAARFQPSMNLHNIKPFSMREIIIIPDALALRETIASAFKKKNNIIVPD